MPEFDGLSNALGCDVSRETIERLKIHQALLQKWNPAINLVAPSTIKGSWSRHILDSAQVFNLTPLKEGKWLDFGTGGGFPGLVCGILAAELAPDLTFHYVESDRRKSTFLSTVLRETGVSGTVLPQRIEDLPPQAAQVISARAVAPLLKLLTYAYPHLTSEGKCLFPKGARYSNEEATALTNWRFKIDRKPSITDPNAVILILGEIERV